MPESLTCRRSLRGGLLNLGMAVGFTVLGYLLVRAGRPGAGWPALLFFGPASLLLLASLFDRRPQLVISGDGVWIRSQTTIAAIPWHDVERVSVERQRAGPRRVSWLHVKAQNIEAYAPPHRTVNQITAALRFPVPPPDTVVTTVFNLDATGDEILRAVKAFR